MIRNVFGQLLWLPRCILFLAVLVTTPTWAEPFDVETKLTASDAAAGDWFGSSVAISGNNAIVGAYGDEDSGPGSAYVFDVATGDKLFKLTASDVAERDLFGHSVAISGNRAIIGAPGIGGFASGSAYLFDVTTGDQLFKLNASDTADNGFGSSVAISGNRAIVGAFLDHDGGFASGSAYLFDVTTGEQLFKLTASDAAANHQFGYSVAISGNTVIVGARNGEDGGDSSGSAYVFAPEP